LEWGNRSNEKLKRLITEDTEIGAKRAQRRGKERKKERKYPALRRREWGTPSRSFDGR
jgi:hypothetical protein